MEKLRCNYGDKKRIFGKNTKRIFTLQFFKNILTWLKVCKKMFCESRSVFMQQLFKAVKKLFFKRVAITPIVSVILMFVCSVIVANIIFDLSIATEQEQLFFSKSIGIYPSLFWLNYLPILFFIVLFYFLTNHTIFSICFPSGIFIILTIANGIKIKMRQDPLLPSDITLIREVAGILQGFDKESLERILFQISLFMVILLASLLFFKNQKMKWSLRIWSVVIVFLLGGIANQKWYASQSIYDQYPVTGNIYFQVNQYHSKGIVYSSLHNLNTMQVKKPQQYNAAEYKKREQPPMLTSEQKENLPNIIMIMGEAYSDLSINEHIDFSHYIDPMKNYKEIISQEDTIAGHIVVPNYGGGTSDTEYDVLTACPTRYLDNALPSYNFVRKNFDALPRRLAQIGYDTLAIHPGYLWFYNRYNVYPHFGFDTFINLESFDIKTQSKGGYISEKATTDAILQTLKQHIKESDKPLFSFTVTIQNHGPYQNKYNETEKNFDTDVFLTEEEQNMLYNYFNGLKDVDKEIARLLAELEKMDEPVVVVYFGDHLPGFTNGMDFFDILDYDIDIEGTTQQRLRVYETPYFIWQNESAKNSTKILENKEKLLLPEGNLISAHYLGAMTMELLGLEGLSPLYDYVNEMRKELPIIANGAFLQGNGTFIDEVTQQQQQKIEYLIGWQYYKLFDENVE